MLDRYVWRVASQAISDPNFFEQMLAKTDEVAGAAARAASLQRQLEDSTREGDNLFEQLRRLDQDDPENARSIARYQAEIRDIEKRCAELSIQLQATLAEAEKEKERRASVEAFHQYAASERATLEQKAPLERRKLLGSLHTRVRMRKINGRSWVEVHFDVRYLPGAIEALSQIAQRGGGAWRTSDTGAPIELVTMVMRHGVEWMEAGFKSKEAYDSWTEHLLAEQERAGERYSAWLAATGHSDSFEAYLEWETTRDNASGQPSAPGGRLSPEPPPDPDSDSPSVLAERTGQASPSA
jgi:hypothetical protein